MAMNAPPVDRCDSWSEERNLTFWQIAIL